MYIKRQWGSKPNVRTTIKNEYSQNEYTYFDFTNGIEASNKKLNPAVVSGTYGYTVTKAGYTSVDELGVNYKFTGINFLRYDNYSPRSLPAWGVVKFKTPATGLQMFLFSTCSNNTTTSGIKLNVGNTGKIYLVVGFDTGVYDYKNYYTNYAAVPNQNTEYVLSWRIDDLNNFTVYLNGKQVVLTAYPNGTISTYSPGSALYGTIGGMHYDSGYYYYSGTIYDVFVSAGRVSNRVLKDLSVNPYGLLDVKKIYIPNATIPGLNFIIENAVANTVMGSINVTQNQTLPIANALSNTVMDAVALLQAQGLTLANLVSTPSLGTAALTQQHMLSIFNAQSNSEASALTLSQQQQLNILNLDAASFVDAVIVTSDGTQILVVANMTAASELQAAGLTQQHIFNITDVIAHSFAQDLSVIQNDGTVTLIALDTYSQTYLNNVLLSQSQVININSFVSNSFAESLIVALATLGAIQLPGVTALTPKRDLNSLTPVREVRTIH